MAWRIHESVIRGEVDNREREVVRGKIWIHGIADPIGLELKGNACADMAGCRLVFENTKPTLPMGPEARLWPAQRGSAGDMTASRKVRVFDLPFEEAYARLKKKLPVPERVANCLYLEWFSHHNGRVVIETTDYKLTISAPAWRLTAEDEERRQTQAAEGFNHFIQQLSEAVEAEQHRKPEDKEWDEFDYEKFMRESDARTEKYSELLDKYRDHPDRDRIIAAEMGWTWLQDSLDEGEDMPAEAREPGDDDSSSQKAPGEPDVLADAEEMSESKVPLDPDPATEGVDWVRDAQGRLKHPLCLRALNGATDLWQECSRLEVCDDPDVSVLITEYQTTSAKLAGALNSLGYGRHLREGAFIVAYLKRGLNHLHAAQAALERVTQNELLPRKLTDAARAELFSLREEILRLMQDFRRK